MKRDKYKPVMYYTYTINEETGMMELVENVDYFASVLRDVYGGK